MSPERVMTRTRSRWAWPGAAVLFILFVLFGGAMAGPVHAEAAKDAIVIVVPKSNAVNGLSSGELRKILLGEETEWPNKEKITILLLPPGSDERKAALQILLKMSDDDFVRHWISEVFQGLTATGPKTASSPTSMLKLVADLPSALGIVSVGDLPAGESSLKVLSIDGKTPGETGYLLAR
jgi:ABC-type phosphate transport system substrate-binding protein